MSQCHKFLTIFQANSFKLCVIINVNGLWSFSRRSYGPLEQSTRGPKRLKRQSVLLEELFHSLTAPNVIFWMAYKTSLNGLLPTEFIQQLVELKENVNFEKIMLHTHTVHTELYALTHKILLMLKRSFHMSRFVNLTRGNITATEKWKAQNKGSYTWAWIYQRLWVIPRNRD